MILLYLVDLLILTNLPPLMFPTKPGPTASSLYFKSYHTATDLSTTTSEPTALSTNTTESSTNGLSAQISVPAAPDVFVPDAEREPLTFVSLACRGKNPILLSLKYLLSRFFFHRYLYID